MSISLRILALLGLALCGSRLGAQDVISCNWETLDSARAASAAGRWEAAAEFAKSTSRNCFSGAHLLYEAYDRQGKRLEFLDYAVPLARAGDGPLAYFAASVFAKLVFLRGDTARGQALQLFDIAHRAGVEIATWELGSFWFRGGFRPTDYSRSAVHYPLAAKYFAACSSHPAYATRCKEALGHVDFAEGRVAEAITKFEQADAVEALRAIYRFGLRGRTPDIARAASLERRMAVDTNRADDVYGGVSPLLVRDLRSYRAGEARAAYELARRFNDQEPHGAPDDPGVYLSLLDEAVTRGYPNAAEFLGDAYSEGELTRRDYVLAYANYNIAVGSASESTRERVGRRLRALEGLMTAQDISEAQRISRERVGGKEKRTAKPR